MVEAGWLKRRRKVVACLVVFLHYDLPVKHPSPLPQHVEEELREHCGDNENVLLTVLYAIGKGSQLSLQSSLHPYFK